MHRRLRSSLLGLLALVTAATGLVAAAPAPAPGLASSGGVRPVVITSLRAQEPGTAADDGPVERDDNNPWKLKACRAAAEPGEGNPTRDARAKKLLRGDGVSFRSITATLDGVLG